MSFFAALEAKDFISVGFLVFLEGVLSIDNALVLALIVGHLPEAERKKALAYGIFGAIAFRIIAISLATYLMHWLWVKFIGGFYLLYLAIEYFWEKHKVEEQNTKTKKTYSNFWVTVLIVELTDIAFAIDSILTAVALTSKTWVVITGGVLGLIMMRFAASKFIVLLEKYPRFEPTAYILVLIIGTKLLVDGLQLPYIDFHAISNPAFWIFWGAMALAFCFGFTGQRSRK